MDFTKLKTMDMMRHKLIAANHFPNIYQGLKVLAKNHCSCFGPGFECCGYRFLSRDVFQLKGCCLNKLLKSLQFSSGHIKQKNKNHLQLYGKNCIFL